MSAARAPAALAALLLLGAAPATRAFRDCRDCPEMVALPPGRFQMGSPADEPGRLADEGPQHDVTVRRFAIGRTDVTRGQWRAFVAATHRPIAGGCAWAGPKGPTPDPAANWDHVDFAQDDDHPVVCVTWADAQDYVRWLSRRTGHAYRLPSEAEWEYAARGGTRTAFPWGPTASHEQANYGTDGCCDARAEGRDRWIGTAPVAAFPANGFGLFDMSGNVLQWTQDCRTAYAAAPADARAIEFGPPIEGRDACAFRMLRGGDWGDPPFMLRAAYRNYAPAPGSTIADYRSAGVGFRVVRAID